MGDRLSNGPTGSGDSNPNYLEGQLTITEILEAEEAAEHGSETLLVAPPPEHAGRPPAIRRFWFRNFKGFADFAVDLGDFNVLAGANNAGKSTILQGIDLSFSATRSRATCSTRGSWRELSPKSRRSAGTW
jgi:hypothetical protein